MSYRRIIPRDLFNDGNLLKCLGALWIALDDAKFANFACFITEDVPVFDIVQCEADGSTYVRNIEFNVRGVEHLLFRPLNSRQAWPLYCRNIYIPDPDDIPVFDDDGKLSAEFIRYIS